MRRPTELDDHVRLEELVLGGDSGNRSAPELAERREQAAGVHGRLLPPEIDVSREAWVTVVDHSLAPDQEIANVVSVEQFDQLPYVG